MSKFDSIILNYSDVVLQRINLNSRTKYTSDIIYLSGVITNRERYQKDFIKSIKMIRTIKCNAIIIFK